jgi:hypothetical protein
VAVPDQVAYPGVSAALVVTEDHVGVDEPGRPVQEHGGDACLDLG